MILMHFPFIPSSSKGHFRQWINFTYKMSNPIIYHSQCTERVERLGTKRCLEMFASPPGCPYIHLKTHPRLLMSACVFELLQITCQNRAAALGLLSTDEERRDKNNIESDRVVMGMAIILEFSITSCDLESVQGNFVLAVLRAAARQ